MVHCKNCNYTSFKLELVDCPRCEQALEQVKAEVPAEAPAEVPGKVE